jgi:hypothetical protein
VAVDGRQLDRMTPPLTLADLCIWHGCGTDLSRRQLATTEGASTDQARVCLAVPPPVSATLSGCVVDQSTRRRQICGGSASRSASSALSLAHVVCLRF